MRFSPKIIVSLIIFIWPAILAINLARAEDTQVNFTPQVSIPGSEFQSQQDVLVTDDTGLICSYVIAIYKYAIAIIGILAVLAVAIGGVMWITSAGNSGRIGEGKEWITSGLLGLILALGSFMVLASINKDLVTCKLTAVPDVQHKEDASSATVYGQAGAKCKEAIPVDSSGNYWCCVIKGKLESSGFIKDTTVQRCATYQAASKEAAQPQCNNFYDSYDVKGTPKNFWGAFVGWPVWVFWSAYIGPDDLSLAERQSISGGDNSATLYQGKCWEIPEINKWCMCADDPAFCKSHDDGTSCLTAGGEWGYCGNATCHTCKKHCQACVTDKSSFSEAPDYQCPNQQNSPSNEAGVICGDAGYTALSSDSNDCVSFNGTEDLPAMIAKDPSLQATWQIWYHSDVGYCDKEFGDGCTLDEKIQAAKDIVNIKNQ